MKSNYEPKFTAVIIECMKAMPPVKDIWEPKGEISEVQEVSATD